MDETAARRWLDSYVDAWRTYDPDQIGALFTADATYSYAPWGPPLRGRETIVADWLRDRDEPGSWEARYEPLAIQGDTVVATGETRYRDGRTYANVFVMRFTGERCADFVEWYMEHPADHE